MTAGPQVVAAVTADPAALLSLHPAGADPWAAVELPRAVGDGRVRIATVEGVPAGFAAVRAAGRPGRG